MPKIRLKQKQGEYGWGDKDFFAGKTYDVDNKTAFYLVHTAKVAEEITESALAKESIPDLKENVSPVPMSPEILDIALVCLGGLGDGLILSGLATAVKRKYPKSHTTLFVRYKNSAELLVGNKNVDRVVTTGQKTWNGVIDNVLSKEFDIVYDNRYVVKVTYKDVNRFKSDKAKTDNLFKDYAELFETFPFSNNTVFGKTGLGQYKLMLKTAGLEGNQDDLHVDLTEGNFNMLALLEGSKYVTVHNGADIARQTKCWITERWSEVASYLKKKGYKVIQLGQTLEDRIDGTIDMRGKSEIKETAAFIAKAKFHMDSESGLVHIARAVRTRSIVLFGPTSFGFFKYDKNVNVETSSKCKDCWWTNDMWWRECPKGHPLPVPCMKGITVDMVTKAIDKIEKIKPLEKEKNYDKDDVNEKFAMELVLDEAHYKSEPCQWDRVQTMMAKVKGKDVLEVGAGDGYCSKVLTKRGFNVTSIEVSKIRLERMKKKGIKAQYGDIHKLPFPDNSFDTVNCGEVLEHIPIMSKGLAELERVCRPDGKIIISLPVGKVHQNTKMHLWGITHHSILRNGKLDMIVLELDQIHRDGNEK